MANGGLGLGYGIVGLDDGATDGRGAKVEQVYEQLSAPDPRFRREWREHAVPFSYWGCQVYSCQLPDSSVIDLDGYDWARNGIPLVTGCPNGQPQHRRRSGKRPERP